MSSATDEPRVITTAIHGPGFHACGIQPQPTDDAVDLDQNHHPGFGFIALMRGQKTIWTAGPNDDGETLRWLEEHFCAEAPRGRWWLDVQGPMVSYKVRRKREGYWVLAESGMGFA